MNRTILARMFGSLMAFSAIACAAVRPDMLVSTGWLAQHLTDPQVVILHVAGNRTAYDAGHIPGARFVALPSIAITRDSIPNELPPVADLKKVLEAAGVSDDSRVILYGDTSVLPATRAYFTFDYLGHGDRTSLLDGGLEKWRAEGRALTKDAPAETQGRFTPHPKPELVVQMDAVKQMTSHAGATPSSEILLDARPATDYTGEKGSHIPGALNLFWMESQVSRENQTLKPEAELRKLYEAIGVTPNRPVVTYCHSGMQASQAYFTLKYLGYDVRLYDGSMSEWNLRGAPVEK
ncbi:MAG TPA: sulfurtransferase [Bryobacteraceae bacterium]|nr:sulfurtransferase [Bryobacteraceae bacterium]